MKHVINDRYYQVASIQANLGDSLERFTFSGKCTSIVRISYWDKSAQMGERNRGYDSFYYDGDNGLRHKFEKPPYSYGKLNKRFDEMQDKKLNSIVYDDETGEIIVTADDGARLCILMPETI